MTEAGRGGSRAGLAFLANLALAICAILATVEAVALGYGLVVRGDFAYAPSSTAKVRAAIGAALADRGVEGDATTEIPILSMHPYLGFVHNSERRQTKIGDYGLSASGFFSDVELAHRRQTQDEFVVGLVGGSVAAELWVRAGGVLAERIASCRPDRRVVVNVLAQPGFKQPQQLLAVAYALTLGADLDLVLNLDGVNDVLWYHHNAMAAGVDPSFPYNWHWLLLQSGRDAVLLDASAEIRTIRARVRAVGSAVQALGLERTAAGALAWHLASERGERGERRASDRLRVRSEELGRGHGFGFEQAGPRLQRFADPGQALDEAAAVWMRGSLLLQQLLEARGITYLHALQPNQYFAGTKPLTETERARFVVPDSIYSAPLREGYGPLRSAGARLVDAGVRFHDLSGVFRDVRDELYSDECCHFNVQGYRLLAEALGRLTCSRRP